MPDFRVLETHPLSLGNEPEEQIQELLDEFNDFKRRFNDLFLGVQQENVFAVTNADGLADNLKGGKDPVANQKMAKGKVVMEVDGADDVECETHLSQRTTTDATVTELDTIYITADRTYFIETRVVARRTGGSAGTADDGASYVVRGTYKTSSGTVALIGSLTAAYTAEDVAGWTATLVISGATVGLRVTGATNTNITWHGCTTVQSVGS